MMTPVDASTQPDPETPAEPVIDLTAAVSA